MWSVPEGPAAAMYGANDEKSNLSNRSNHSNHRKRTKGLRELCRRTAYVYVCVCVCAQGHGLRAQCMRCVVPAGWGPQVLT